MNFEEIGSIWNNSDQQIDNKISINKKILKELALNKVKSGLYEIRWTSYISIFSWAIFLLFLASFIKDNFSEYQFSFPAFLLVIIGLLALIFDIYKLKMIFSIDADAPVVEAQQKLARLKYAEIFDTYSLYVLIPLLSAPFLIVLAKAFVGFNIYSLGSTWMILQIVGSIVIAIVIVFILRRYPNRNLKASIDFLNEIKESKD